MTVAFACIAPHGDLDEIPQLRAAMEELGRRFDAAAVDTAIVVTPHNVHVDRHFAVVTAARVGEWEVDRETAAALLRADLPILGVSYGGLGTGIPKRSFPLYSSVGVGYPVRTSVFGKVPMSMY